MVINSTNINKTNNQAWHMTLEIQFLFWDMHKNVAGLNRLMRSYPSPLNWISNSNTYVKKTIKNLYKISSTQKDHIISALPKSIKY